MFTEKIINQQFIKTIRLVFLLGILILVGSGNSWSEMPAQANGVLIKVMPLGDSITVGKYSGPDTSDGASADDIGYRKDLYTLLTTAGYTVDFVGTQSNGLFADPHHEGHNGWTDSQIADNIYDNGGANWLTQNPPDIILLHIGTNSFNTDPSDVANILNEIDDYESATSTTVKVIVARIIDWVPNNPSVHTFNNNVESMVKARSDYGTNLFLVDLESQAGLIYKIKPGGDMIDSLHPFEGGYTKMADCWKLKFDEIYGTPSTNNLPDFDSPLGNQSNSEGETITPRDMGATDPDGGDTLTYSALNLPPGLTINSSTGEISGTVSSSASSGSPYYVAISVFDGNPCGNTRHLFNWTINEDNYPPQIHTSVPNRTDDEGDYVEIQVSATDPNDTNLTYSATNLPPGISINQNSGLIAGTISFVASDDPLFPNFEVTVKVEDDGNPKLWDEVSFTWTVNDVVTDSPVVNNPGNQSSKPGDIVSLQIIASDPNGDEISFRAENLPSNLEINLSSGEISGEIAPFAVLASPYHVSIIVSDDTGSETTIHFDWFVMEDGLYLPLVTSY